MPLKGLVEEQENTCPNSQQPQQPQPMRSAIRARLDHLSMDDMGPMPPTADEAFAESVSVLLSGPANALPSSGWQAWPVASEAHRGLVYLPCEGCFGYHDDVEADDECVVHFSAPRAGRAHVYPRAALLQPPFSTHHICTAAAAARQAEAEAAPPKQAVAPLTPQSESDAAWAAGFATQTAIRQQADAEAVRLRQAVQTPKPAVPSAQPSAQPKPAVPSAQPKPQPAAAPPHAPLTPTSGRVSCKTASRITLTPAKGAVKGGGLLSELQIASRIRQLALFDEPAPVLPL